MFGVQYLAIESNLTLALRMRRDSTVFSRKSSAFGDNFQTVPWLEAVCDIYLRGHQLPASFLDWQMAKLQFSLIACRQDLGNFRKNIFDSTSSQTRFCLSLGYFCLICWDFAWSWKPMLHACWHQQLYCCLDFAWTWEGAQWSCYVGTLK